MIYLIFLSVCLKIGDIIFSPALECIGAVQRGREKRASKSLKKVNKEFKLLVLVVVRKSSIVKLETVLRGWYWGTLIGSLLFLLHFTLILV